jgi:O-antigen ligase
MTFNLYILYLVSFLLHLTSRVPALGAIRFDMILSLLVLVMMIAGHKKPVPLPALVGGRPAEPGSEKIDSGVAKMLYIIYAYIIVTLPLVEYPGSVLHTNLLNFFKATLFFFFTANLVDTRRRLQILIVALLECQIFRVLEPLYLNLTTGYWGSETWIGNGELADRLSGGPYDVINSNGLAFVILMVLPFMHYLTIDNPKLKWLYFALFPLMLMALIKSLSRSGMIALFIAYGGVFMRSKRKALIILMAAIMLPATYFTLSDIQKDRYLSIVSSNTRQGATASGRIEGLGIDLGIALKRPLFGHGLGTSAETKYHLIGNGQLAHDLYLEVAQELGFVGLALFLLFLKRIVDNFRLVKRKLAAMGRSDPYIARLVEALQVWMLVSLFFSLASYGLSEWTWYFFAGISLAVVRVVNAEQTAQAREQSAAGNLPPQKPVARSALAS